MQRFLYVKECSIYNNLGVYTSRATKFCAVGPDICGYSVWNLLHVTLQLPRILEDCKVSEKFLNPFRNHFILKG